LFTLGENLTPFPAPRGDSTLVARGIYCLVRHPVYGGLVVASGGVALFDGNPAGLAVAGVLTAYLWAKAGFEERRLVARFPDYARYRTQVARRLIPWVL
jgi:protein-S-isoprenylcysteine O-methyltransferase Ste14